MKAAKRRNGEEAKKHEMKIIENMAKMKWSENGGEEIFEKQKKSSKMKKM